MNDFSYKYWEAMTDQALLGELGKFFQHHRIKQNMTQAEASSAAGISRSTLSLLERGEPVALSSVIRVLRALDLLYVMDTFQVDDSISPIEYAKLQSKKKKRVRN
jgi:transcriptional regulator with XRE-family HTH domain